MSGDDAPSGSGQPSRGAGERRISTPGSCDIPGTGSSADYRISQPAETASGGMKCHCSGSDNQISSQDPDVADPGERL